MLYQIINIQLLRMHIDSIIINFVLGILILQKGVSDNCQNNQDYQRYIFNLRAFQIIIFSNIDHAFYLLKKIIH
jgi:hypothetical protein